MLGRLQMPVAIVVNSKMCTVNEYLPTVEIVNMLT